MADLANRPPDGADVVVAGAASEVVDVTVSSVGLVTVLPACWYRTCIIHKLANNLTRKG